MSMLTRKRVSLDVPKDGEVFYQNENLAEIDRDRFHREHIGMIFQSYYLLPQLTALENAELSLELAKYKGSKKDRAEKMRHCDHTRFRGSGKGRSDTQNG